MTNLTNKKQNNICIFGGSLDVGNRGVNALTVSLIKLLHNTVDNAKFFLMHGSRSPFTRSVLVNGQNIDVQVVNFRLSPKSKLNEHLFWILLLALLYRLLPLQGLRNYIARSNTWIRTILDADLVGDIRGGDSFSDIYGVKRCVLEAIPAIVTLLLNKELYQFPQTYGPFQHWISRSVSRAILHRSHLILTRDKNCFQIIQNLLGNRFKEKRILFCPDVAFILDAQPPKDLKINSQQHDIFSNSAQNVIGFNISGLLFAGGYTRNNMFQLNFEYSDLVVDVIEFILKKTGSHVLLIPHVFSKGLESDVEACREVMKRIDQEHRNQVSMVEGEYSASEIKSVIGNCDFFIGSRMHSCIAALSQSVPCVSFAYSDKFIGIYQSVDLDHLVIDLRKMIHQEILDRCVYHFEHKEDIARQLKTKIPEVQQQLIHIFQSEMSMNDDKRSVSD